VPLLQLPAIKLVDPKKGMVPTVVTLHSVITGVGKLRGMYPQLVSFFVDAKAEYIFNFWHTTLAFFLRSHPPPPGVRISNVAPQFALSSLDVRDLGFWEIVGKSTIDAMAALIAQTGPCLSLSARPQPNSLPPILEVPAAVTSFSSRLILCYFLAQPDAVRLERLLAQFSISGVEIHCFTTAPLTPPAGRPLALESHAKQRALFKHYFDRCTGATRRRSTHRSGPGGGRPPSRPTVLPRRLPRRLQGSSARPATRPSGRPSAAACPS